MEEENTSNVGNEAIPNEVVSSPDHYHVIHDNAHMISELETRLLIIFWSNSMTIEVVCRVLGVKEDMVRMFVDYRSLYVAVIAPADLVKMKKSRKAHILDFLLVRLALIHDTVDQKKWVLTLRQPKERKPSISGPEGHNHNVEVINNANDLAAKILQEETSSKEKEKKRLEQQEELLKYIRDQPTNVPNFNYDEYERLKK